MTYRAISATTETLIALLESRFHADSLLGPLFDAGAGGTMVISPRTPEEMATANETGLSVWLYRIARDPELLNRPQRRLALDQIEQRPLPVRCYYLMTPVVNQEEGLDNDPGVEQLIIGKVLQSFHDFPQLSGALLRGDLVGSGSTIGVRWEPLGLEEITRVWDALESSYQLCVSYETSVVVLASDAESDRVTPVESVEPEYGVMGEADS